MFLSFFHLFNRSVSHVTSSIGDLFISDSGRLNLMASSLAKQVVFRFGVTTQVKSDFELLAFSMVRKNTTLAMLLIIHI